MPQFLDTTKDDFETKFDALLNSKREASGEVSDVVKNILSDVQSRGNAALFDLTAKFDSFELSKETLRITGQEIDAAVKACKPETLDALRQAAQRIESYHQRQVPDDDLYTDAEGIRLGHRWTAIEAAGLYVPGGTASYPSSVLMNAIPARVAGVERVVMTVPTPDGVLNPLVLAAAKIAGVDEVYRVGGAQAIGALAYGTESIAPVDMIVGPGNAFVAEAKAQVFGTVGIDMIAGPSEILVVADDINDPTWIAADLLSQVEHDVSSQSILITDSQSFADQVVVAIESELQTLPRADIARAAWEKFGAIIVVSDLENALPLIDRIAPEHLELAVGNADTLAATVRNAGAIFLGRYAPEAVGDYIAGTNHVLPTARSARFSSGLSVLTFMKRISLVGCDADGLAKIGPAAELLAKAEGLDGHGRSIAIRRNQRT